MSARELNLLRVLPATPIVSKPSDRASVDIYRPFFIAGILCVLTVGCLLGAIALFGIGRSSSYTNPAWTPYILAHANSQLFGWVGFFVMGFSLQQHAPSLSKAAQFHRLAWASLLLMSTGIALRFVAEPMVQSNRVPWLAIGVVSCSIQSLSIILFLANIAITRHRPSTALAWQTRFVFASLFWLLALAIVEPVVLAKSHQVDDQQSVLFIARWYPVLREAQFLGFVSMMIFGVALVKLNSCFGAKPANESLGKLGFFLWNVGLMSRMIGWGKAFDSQFAGQSQFPYFLGGGLIFISAAVLVASSRIFEATRSTAISHKFVRGALGWLLLAGLLFIAEPIFLKYIGAPFSHAYTGAIRHAVTVGFISQMILGFGAHVIARMNDLEESLLPSLWNVFWLLNVGNFARVALEIATDLTPDAYPLMGITGFVELTGLAIWAYHVSRPLLKVRGLKVVHAK